MRSISIPDSRCCQPEPHTRFSDGLAGWPIRGSPEGSQLISFQRPNSRGRLVRRVNLLAVSAGRGNEPSEARTSSKSPYNLFSNAELAKELLQAVSEFEERLSKLLEKSKELEPADEHKKFTRAWGSVVWELGQNLLHPVYRRHKELIPEALKGEIL